MGLRVPVDVSVASLHDAPLAEFLDPPLTTVRMPLEEMGRRAVEIVLLERRERPEAFRVDSPPVLVLRDSTSLPPSRGG
jgi:DNA-binding LacI/PurR family transcriptional regulator